PRRAGRSPGAAAPARRAAAVGARSGRDGPAGPLSREDAGEGVVQLTGVVEDALRQVIHRPVDRREVVLHPIPQTREHLVAVTRRVEEVDRGTPGDAMPRRTDV